MFAKRGQIRYTYECHDLAVLSFNRYMGTECGTNVQQPITDECRAVFDGGVRGFDPPQEVADPPRKFCRTSLGGSTLTPIRTPRFHFLLNHAAYASIETDVI